jgi:hypothetical protein
MIYCICVFDWLVADESVDLEVQVEANDDKVKVTMAV